MSAETLALIMPVYNESAIVGEVLSRWELMLGHLGVDYQIYAYNDGSKDNSLAILKNYAEMPGHRVTVIDQPNAGHGPTVLRGYRECCSQYDWIFQLDSDDEIAPEDFVKLWELRSDHDFVIGKRVGRVQNWSRRLISKVSAYSAKLLYGCPSDDVNCPYRLMRASVFSPLFREVPEDSFAPNVMLSGLAGYYKLRSAEIPVAQSSRRTGEVSIRRFKLVQSALLSFLQLFLLRYRLIRHKQLLRLGILCFLLALIFLLIPNQHQAVEPEMSASDGVTAYELYKKQPWQTVQQLDVDIRLTLKSGQISPGDILLAIPNSGVCIRKRSLAQLEIPESPTGSYHFHLLLYDDLGVIFAAPATTGETEHELREVMYNVNRGHYVKSTLSQYLLINDKCVTVSELKVERVVDPLLPKVIGAALAALGTGLLIAFVLLRYGKPPEPELRQKLFLLVAVIAGGVAAALAMCVYYRLNGALEYPYGTFLYVAQDRFNDLFNTFTVMRFMGDYPYAEQIAGSSYFPFSYLLFKLVPAFNQMYVIFFSYTVFLSFYLVSAFAVCCRRGAAIILGLLAVLLLNYPLWFMLDRGNTDSWVYSFIFLFVWCYRRQWHGAAIFFLICAVNLKLYPAILAVFYLKDRAYGKFMVAALGSLTVFVLSLGFFDWNLSGLLTNLQRYQECYVESFDGVNNGHSLFGLFKIFANQFLGIDRFSDYTRIHTVLAMVVAALVSCYVIWVEKVFWKNLFLLLAMLLLLPHVSLDYRMIVLVIPVLYFLRDETRERHQLLYAVWWGLLLIPVHWIFLYHGELRQLSVFFRPLLLVGLVVFIMYCGMRQWYRDKKGVSTVERS